MGLTDLLCVADFEAAARSVLDTATFAYVAGGAGDGATIATNRAAFDAVALSPRILTGASAAPKLEASLFGRSLPMPVLLAPTSPQRLLWPEAELATARGAARQGVACIVSTDTHAPFHDIVAASPGDCWFQLYCYGGQRDIEATLDYAVQAGAQAVVLTVDADHPARRLSSQRAGFCAPSDVDLGTLRTLGLFDGALPHDARLPRTSLSWRDLEWIRPRVPTPLLVKGVMHGEDARRCVELGVDGLIVSNHGGRQLDGVRASLHGLSEVLDAVDRAVPVLLDSGVRSGLDVVRALSLGAAAVCLGRPYLWGLALGGAEGVERVLALLREELLDTLRQLGCASLRALGPACVAHPPLCGMSSTSRAGAVEAAIAFA
jgi:isopentenyl diphosphate isomerase/L-lactate dehydrogenase-like FMN-dependent dehydrogenase